MFFHSLTSLLIFLPIFFSIYYFLSRNFKELSLWYLLLFSLIFYSYDVPWFLIPLLISAIGDYLIARELIFVASTSPSPNRRTLLLIISLFINLSLLITLKYTDFISQTLDFLFFTDFGLKSGTNFILPAGISFYTFQTLSFTIETFRGKTKKLPRFRDYLLYVSYFPQLVAGPILRSYDFFKSEGNLILASSNSNFQSGITRICFGLCLKLVLDWFMLSLG